MLDIIPSFSTPHSSVAKLDIQSAAAPENRQ
jgi:hypothetical protein